MDDNLTKKDFLKGGSKMSNEITVHGAVIRVLLAITLVLGLMPSLSNTSVYAQNDEANSNSSTEEVQNSASETDENTASNDASGESQTSDDQASEAKGELAEQ